MALEYRIYHYLFDTPPDCSARSAHNQRFVEEYSHLLYDSRQLACAELCHKFFDAETHDIRKACFHIMLKRRFPKSQCSVRDDIEVYVASLIDKTSSPERLHGYYSEDVRRLYMDLTISDDFCPEASCHDRDVASMIKMRKQASPPGFPDLTASLLFAVFLALEEMPYDSSYLLCDFS